MNKESEVWMDGETDIKMDIHTEKLWDRQTDNQLKASPFCYKAK
jgi:hypothetical protein